MPEISAKDPALSTLDGVHLWHAPMSSCSQRVRIVLSEMGRDYESHIVDLGKDEHASAEYQRIHPNGLVPALVEDGHLFVELIDIIRHLADGALAAERETDLLAMADAAQKDLKLLSFEFLFRARPAPPAEKAAAFQERHQNALLRQFRVDFAAGFDPVRVNAAIKRTDEGFRKLDALLADGRLFLSGPEFTITDVAWMPNVHRMQLMDWPFERTPHLAGWFGRVSQRPSYREGLVAWQSSGEADLFATYTARRQAEGTDVRSFPHFKDSR